MPSSQDMRSRAEKVGQAASINARTTKQVTPIMLAAYSCDIDTIRLLLKHHANIEDESDSGYVLTNL